MKILNHFPHIHQALGVQTGTGLVKDYQIRIMQEALGQAQALPHPVRKRRDLVVLPTAQSHKIHQFQGTLAIVLDPGGSGEQFQVLKGAEVFIKIRFFDQASNPCKDGLTMRAVRESKQRKLTPAGANQIHQHPECRAFARPVGTQKTHHTARFQFKIQSVNGPKGPVVLDQINGLDHGGIRRDGGPGAHRLSSSKTWRYNASYKGRIRSKE